MALYSLSRTRPRIGAMRRRLTIEAPIDAEDGVGGVERSYALQDVAWASIETRNAVPTFDDNRPAARRALRIVLRWRADLTSAHRLRLGQRIFRIRAIADADDRRERIALLCEEDAQ